MKFIFAFIGFLMLVGKTNAQKIQEIISKDIEHAIPVFESMTDAKRFAEVKVLGLGDVATFAKESKTLTTAFSAYLISKHKFRNILLQVDDWQIRPLNTYLTAVVRADTLVLDSLIKSIFSSDFQFRNREFRSFLQWVKKYNSTYPNDQVNIFGVAPSSKIPPAYFLANYVFEMDKSYGQQLSEKWADEDISDSVAYADISAWLGVIKKTKTSKAHQELALSCEEDLLHNKHVLAYTSFDQQFSQKQLNTRSRYIADQVVKKSGKKTILYAMTNQVVKADMESSMVLNNLPVSSIGKYLGDELQAAYQTFVIDFADKARLIIVDIAARQGNLEDVAGTAQAKALYQKGEFIDRKKGTAFLKGYKPALIWPFKIQTANIILKKDDDAVIDALFLFSTLSELDLTY